MGSEFHTMEEGVGKVAGQNGASAIDGVKFTKAQDGDGGGVDMAHPTTKLIGLTKEQLEQYRNDPFWKAMRYALFILFWLVWAAMFVGAILIVVLSPKCAAKVEPKWHENAVAYHIFTPTFRDASGEGVGDFRGVEEKLNDLRKVGASAIWLSTIVRSNKDNHYAVEEVEDVLSVDPRFGTEDEFKSLVDATHSNNLKFIMDLPLTASAAKNQWLSAQPGGGQALTVGGPGIAGRQGALLLNVENEQVQEKLVEAARKWLRLGVDGLFLTDYGLAKEMPRLQVRPPTELVRRLRELVAGDETIPQREVLIFTDGQQNTADQTGSNTENYHVQALLEPSASSMKFLDRVAANIQQGLAPLATVAQASNGTTNATIVPTPVRPLWQLAAGSIMRGQRVDQQLAQLQSTGTQDSSLKAHPKQVSSLLSFIQLFLPGPVSVLFGEELALPSAAGLEPGNRWPQLVLQQWDPALGPTLGFSSFTGKQFFPSAPISPGQSFKEQFGTNGSPLKAFTKLAQLRAGEQVFQQGQARFQRLASGLDLLTRFMPDQPQEPVYALVVNWQDSAREWAPPAKDTSEAAAFGAKSPLGRAEVKVPSAFADETLKPGQQLDLVTRPLVIQPYTAVVLRFA